MLLLTLKNLYYSVGEFPLLDSVNLDIHEGEKIALIGRNGEGKSTLMDLLCKKRAPDAGEILSDRTLVIAKLDQELPLNESSTVYEVVAQGLESISQLLIEYHQHAHHYIEGDAWLKKLDYLQHQLEQTGAWSLQQRIERVMQELALPADHNMSALSGGWRRRVMLARALVQEPDLLLLDEPTNHLDLEAIQWLEERLLQYPKTVLFITHDRALLRRVATRIVELDRGKMISYPADYEQYRLRKEQSLLEETRHNALFDKKLSQEEAWIRQGIKARRTRNEGRVRALHALREERKQRRDKPAAPTFSANEVVLAGKTVIQTDNLCFAYPDHVPIIENFTFTIQRGDKIAIVGENGVGKTTLIKLLIGQLTPTSGILKKSPTLEVAFFDQNRDQIHSNETVMANVASGDDFVLCGDKNRHVISYLSDFLFSPAKCRQRAGTLSGGEQNRLLLAKLFAKPANVLVLDEPTNDLDVESLEMLETILLHYTGTIIFISHDREFIDNVATHCIALEGHGKHSINVGGYTDWLHRQTPRVLSPPAKSSPVSKTHPPTQKKKRSYHEQQELEQLPGKIEMLEREIADIQAHLSSSQFYQERYHEIEPMTLRLKQLEKALQDAYDRWETLDQA